MSLSVGSNYYAEFTTANPTTGAAQNADSLPTATATHNGTDDATFTLTITNMATGRYKVTGTIPSGYATGDYVQVSATATVATVAGVAVIDSFTIGAIDPLAAAVPGSYTSGTAGFRLGYLDVAISSRSTYAGGAVASVTAPVTVGTNNDKAGYSLATPVPTAMQVATAVWSDVTAGDFAAAGSPGKVLVGQLGGAFGAGTSVYTAAALANAPAGGGGTDPWATALPGSYATGTAGHILGSPLVAASVTSPVTLSTSQALSTPRAMDAVADASVTINDALWAAVCAATGKESVVGTSYMIKTPATGTVIRTFTLDSGTAPSIRN